MMRNLPGAVRHGALLGILLSIALATPIGAVTLQLGSSPEIPAARGAARLKHTKNGNVEIRLRVLHLAPPGRITPGADVFVVWVRGLAPGAEAQNLGALQVDKKLSGKLTAVTAMSSFDLFLTCERNQTTTAPSYPELLPVHYVNK